MENLNRGEQDRRVNRAFIAANKLLEQSVAKHAVAMSNAHYIGVHCTN